MLTDIVVDTNVWVDSGNATSKHFTDANLFLTRLLASQTRLRIDPLSRGNERNAQSLIISEYTKHIRNSTVGFYILSQLASTGRIVPVAALPAVRIRKQVRRMIHNVRDRTFLNTAIQSDERVLTSHDYEDFQTWKRPKIQRKFGVAVIEAVAATARL